MFLILAFCLLAGCSDLSGLVKEKPLNVPPEYHQKVGLYVHDKPERFFYPGSATLDVSDLMSFHLQQVLPFTAESAFKQIFSNVELKQPGAKIEFKTPDMPGYFEIKIASARYDYPDPGLAQYQAEITLLVEFKTSGDEVVWKGIFEGSGVGYSDPNVRLTQFGREAASALEDAFQNAVYKMQDAVVNSQSLREYFRWYQAKKMQEQKPPEPKPPQTY